MSTSVTLNGTTYTIPATGENTWGDNVSSYLIALGSGVLQKAGGSFTLTAEVDFGATYGLKSAYYKSRGTNPASAGEIRLANAEYVKWRNAGNSADLGLRVNSSNVLEFNSLPISAIALGTANQVLGMNSGATAQEYKTISGTSNQVSVTHGSNSITLSTPQDIGTGSSPTFAGATLSGVTASRALVTSAGSAVTASAVTATELGYLSGVTAPTGTGALVLATSPTLVTPVIGAATGTSLQLSGLTASRAMVTDASKNLTSSAVTSTELGYLSGVTAPTGTGALVLATSPTLVTPTLGVATATTINKVTLTAPATGSTLTIADGKTLTASNTLTFTGTDSSSVAFGAGGTVVYTSNKLSALAATTSAELAGVISDETGSGALVFGTSPTLSTPTITTAATFNAQAELRLADSDSSNYVGFKAPATVGANKVWILPDADGSANQVLATNGSGTLSWATGLSSSLNQYNVSVGNSSNTSTSTNTSLLGDIKASIGSATATMTIATPCVVTYTSHGFSSGDKVYFTTTGALPTGLSVSTTYYVLVVDANTFNLCTSLANVASATKIATSGTQSGTHTIYFGGFKYATAGGKLPGIIDGSAVTTGYVGEVVTGSTTTGSLTTATAANAANITLKPGNWLILANIYYSLGASTTCSGSRSSISTTSATVDLSNMSGGVNTGAGNDFSNQVQRYVSISASTTYYAVAYLNFATSTADIGSNSYIKAIRIA